MWQRARITDEQARQFREIEIRFGPSIRDGNIIMKNDRTFGANGPQEPNCGDVVQISGGVTKDFYEFEIIRLQVNYTVIIQFRNRSTGDAWAYESKKAVKEILAI